MMRVIPRTSHRSFILLLACILCLPIGCGREGTGGANAGTGTSAGNAPTVRPSEGIMVVYRVRFHEGDDPGIAMDRTIEMLQERLREQHADWTIETTGWDQFEVVAPLDASDPAAIAATEEAIARLIRPMELSFRAAASMDPASRPSEELRNATVETFPTAVDSSGKRWKWFQVVDPARILDAPTLEELDPASETFSTQAKDAIEHADFVGTVRDGEVYILLSDEPDRMLLPDRSWTIESIYGSVDSLGQPAVGLRLDEAGGQRLSALTKDLAMQSLAILINDEVIMAPRIQATLSNHLMLIGIDEASRAQIIEQLTDSLPVDIEASPLTVTAFGGK